MSDDLAQRALVEQTLQALGIVYQAYDHPPVATAEAAKTHWSNIDAMHCKNLFLRNQKGTRHYLVVLEYTKRADLRSVAEQIGDGKLSFGSPERLMAHLGLTPGSVSPFGLINDAEHRVRLALDEDVRSAERLSFHPNINTATFVIGRPDFMRFLEACGNPVQFVRISGANLNSQASI